MSNIDTTMNRRRALKLGGSVTGGLLAASSSLLAAPNLVAASSRMVSTSVGSLPVKEIEAIMQAPGMVMDGVLDIHIERKDLNVIQRIPGDGEVPFKPEWENNGDFFFQSLGNGQAILNGDFGGLLPNEIDPFIDKLLEGGLIFQALHQHFYDLFPQVYFVHFRGIGDPLQLARAAIAAVKVTSTPLPQTSPSHPTTPLPAKELGSILGAPASVEGAGVVSVDVPRRNTVTLQGIRISPELNIATSIAFEPLGNGLQAAVAADFSMVASEVQNVIRVMRQQGWVIGCLYNQETDEQPQLYFSHTVKVGNAIELAHEVRRGLNQTNSVGSPS
ncbi:MAG: DUF1259 domain-containing protein [Chloroflexi bacterium]|nr:DUF1259 domain-containing protein [Chloroflexota bacterium]